MRRGFTIAVWIMVGVVATVALGAGAWVYPWVRDDARLDWVVRTVALDWRDFGDDAAQTRLQYELDHQGIGMQVADSDCSMARLPDGTRQVACHWAVALHVPVANTRVPLHFDSVATLDADGDLL
ncbi:MAG: hypothetical protein AB8H79_25730 [Myxococcota bacterium]